jgi:amino acid transporter
MTEPALKRSLSLPLITFYGLGTIIGAGIYVLVGKVAGLAGLYAPVAFLVAAVLAVLTGLSYAELAARYPRCAGAALYVQEGLRRQWLSVLVGFLIILTGVVSAATLANGFAGYLRVFADVPDWVAMGGLILALGLLAAWGIAESIVAAAIVTILEIGGLIYMIAVTGGSLADLPARLPELTPPLEAAVWQGILLGAFLAFYAFIGFEDMVNVAEEVKEPQRNLPRAILLSLATVTLLYMLVAVIAVLALPLADLTATTAPFALLYTRATGEPATFISLVSLVAVTNGALIQIIMASRVLYGMGHEGWIPKAFCHVHARTRTPLLATALVTTIVAVLAIGFPLVGLAKTTSLIMLVAFVFVNLSLIRIKRRDPHPAGVRTYPIWIPWLGLLTTASFVAYQIVIWFRG